jgi:hypothetical protein
LAGSSIPEHGIRLRDDFTQRTIADTAKAVSYRCSNPDCQRLNVGSNADHDGVINVGVGAHITAASAGGPRYDESAGTDTRRGKDNCIWLCQDCAKLIDSNPTHFSVPLLQDWKRAAEERTFRELRACARPGPRTPGVRSLISTPLYLTALLKGAPSGALATTKEEILLMFVQEQERMAEHEEAFTCRSSRVHQRFLTGVGS